MKRLIIAILLISSVVALASQPFVLEPIVPKKYRLKSGTSAAIVDVPVPDYLQLQRNFDKLARKVQEMQYRADSVFVQRGSGLTNAGGYDTVYLPIKYESVNSYSALAPQQFSALIATYKLSDSSFIVMSIDPTTLGTISTVLCEWYTIGIRKK